MYWELWTTCDKIQFFINVHDFCLKEQMLSFESKDIDGSRVYMFHLGTIYRCSIIVCHL